MVSKDSVKHLLFDLGGVLLDIAPSKTQQAFLQLGGGPLNSVDPFRPPPFVEQLERGELTPSAFFSRLRAYLQTEASDQLLAKAWCEMLLGFPQAKIECLRSLSQEKSLSLLSNTNEIHWERIVELMPGGLATFEEIFDKLFLSYEMGMRKPEKGIYEKALARLDLQPSEVLFIDDWPPNLEAARDCGITAVWFDGSKPFESWDEVRKASWVSFHERQ